MSPFIVVDIANHVTINTFHISLCVNISIGSIPRRKYPLFKGRGYSKVTNVLGAATHHLRPQSARSRARVHGPLCEPLELMASPISCAASCPGLDLTAKALGSREGSGACHPAGSLRRPMSPGAPQSGDCEPPRGWTTFLKLVPSKNRRSL